MKKTKKALLAALACSAVLAGTFGLAACNGDKGGDEGGHTHNYQWVNNEDGTHSEKCQNSGCDALVKADSTAAHDAAGADGACSKCGYKAEANAPEKIGVGEKTVASLNTTGVTLAFEGLETGKEYTLSSENANVKFYVGIEQNNPVTFEYGPATLTVSVKSTQGTLTDVVVKLEEAEEQGGGEEGDYPVIRAEEEVSVTGASFEEPKTYEITLTAGNYQVLSGGAPVSSGIVSIGSSFFEGFVDPIYPEGADEIYALAAGKYYVEVTEEMTFKIAKVSAADWVSDSKGHWHPAGLEAKEDYAEHTFGDWSEVDADGVKAKTCSVCGYKEMEVNGTAKVGGKTESAAVAVNESGTYTVAVKAVQDPEIANKYNPGEQYFKLGGEEAKKYTVKILTSNTTVAASIAGVDNLTDVGEDFVIVLEAGEKAVFNIVSNDENVDVNYTCKVAFKVTVEEAPAPGDILRPVKVTEGENGKTSVAAGEKVYFRLNYAILGADLKITFGEDVTVYNLGYKKTNTGSVISSGDEILESSYRYSEIYLCATSTGADCKINVERVFKPGTKGNPIEATFGEETPNSVTLTMVIREKWYKLESATGGKFTLKANYVDAKLSVYASLTDVEALSDGNTVIVELTAGVPVYILAEEGSGITFNFTVTEAQEDTRGYGADDPIVITGNGEYNLVDADKTYFAYTATEACTIVFTYGDGEFNWEDYLGIICTDRTSANGRGYLGSGFDNKLEVTMSAGETCNFYTQGDANTQKKFTVTVTPAA